MMETPRRATHGRVQDYWNGCRCAACRSAQTRYRQTRPRHAAPAPVRRPYRPRRPLTVVSAWRACRLIAVLRGEGWTEAQIRAMVGPIDPWPLERQARIPVALHARVEAVYQRCVSDSLDGDPDGWPSESRLPVALDRLADTED